MKRLCLSLVLGTVGFASWGVTSPFGLVLAIRSLWRRERVPLAVLSVCLNLLSASLLVTLLVTNPPLPSWMPMSAQVVYANGILKNCGLPSLPAQAIEVHAQGSRNVYVGFRVPPLEAMNFFLNLGPHFLFHRIVPGPNAPRRTSVFQEGRLRDFDTAPTNDVWIVSTQESMRRVEEAMAVPGARTLPVALPQELILDSSPAWPSWYRPHTIKQGWYGVRHGFPGLRIFYDFDSQNLYLYWVQS